MAEILVVGSMGYDTITTPHGKKEDILGGSANYFSLAASKYAKVNVVGVVGEDYKDEDYHLLKSRDVCVDGLQRVPGKTFKWEGKYEDDMNEAITLHTALNVFEKFDPVIPDKYKNAEYVFLANIDPPLQMKVLEQVNKPKFVALDTMNLWIDIKLDELKEAIGKVDCLLINEGEARALSGEFNGIAAAKKLAALGPRAVVIKRGEYGFILYCEDQFFIMPAFPVEHVMDPTGAGDTFAGGFFGYLAKTDQELSLSHMKQACVQGCLMASFTVQDFGVNSLVNLSWEDIEKRQNDYSRVTSLD
ncbi:MAG: sugar kinase [Bdellovibrionales bacterium]|nr:sugar kinase [Bdellovibrionales bacterium]